MFDLEKLQQFLIFAEQGTLSKAAEILHLSQPSLSRNMQALEEELGVTLFQRSKNKLSLTNTGEEAVELSRTFLKQAEELLDTLQRHALKNMTIFVGICSPGIEWEIGARIQENHLKEALHIEQKTTDELLQGLLDESYHLIVTDEVIRQKNVVSLDLFKEQLYLSVPKEHPYALKTALSLEDLQDLTMLLWYDVGSWEPLIQRLTKTTFIRQQDRKAFEALINASELPHFSTNITQQYAKKHRHRIHIPISDTIATKTFHLSVLKKHQGLLELLLPSSL